MAESPRKLMKTAVEAPQWATLGAPEVPPRRGSGDCAERSRLLFLLERGVLNDRASRLRKALGGISWRGLNEGGGGIVGERLGWRGCGWQRGGHGRNGAGELLLDGEGAGDGGGVAGADDGGAAPGAPKEASVGFTAGRIVIGFFGPRTFRAGDAEIVE
jgi:hypothetical protein